jgi:GTP cyclohydrolase I
MNVKINRESIDEARKAIRFILKHVGENPDREGLKDTPDRLLRAWEFIFGGYKQDPKKILSRTFDSDGYNEMVMLKDIGFYSTCEHHMLPFFGIATIAYIPQERVVGVSKLARLVDVFARRMQIQERMTVQIAETIKDALKPMGVMVVIEAQHLCMTSRGVQKQGTSMVTSTFKGVFMNESVRAEFFNLKGRK